MNKRVVNGLEELGSLLRDAEHGYERAAEDVQDADLRARFEALSRERAASADEVDGIIRRLDGTPPPKEGSTSGAAYHMWMDVKSAVTGGDRGSMLKEVYRSEAYLESCYDKVLNTALQGMELSDDAVQAIQRQHGRAREARNHSRAMLEAMGMRPMPSQAMRPLTGGVGSYVVERPIMGVTLAFGIGLVLGTLLTMSIQATSDERRRTG